jgi:hypothetical protein
LQRNHTFKFKITLDRHNAGLKFNCCLSFGPPNFSLPSTFKWIERLKLNLRQCCGTETAETATFCLRGTGTGKYYTVPVAVPVKEPDLDPDLT